MYTLELMRLDGVARALGPFWALNFGAKKNVVNAEASCSLDPDARGTFRPELWISDEDAAVTPGALDGTDVRGDECLEIGFFVSPKLGKAFHKAGLAKVFHRRRCRIV